MFTIILQHKKKLKQSDQLPHSAPSSYLERFRKQFEHHNPPLHKLDAIVRELKSVFGVSSVKVEANLPYAFNWLISNGLYNWADSQPENGPRAENVLRMFMSQEQSGIREGVLRALGVLIIAQRT